MSFDVKSFRRALGCFATGITVVSARDEDNRAFGITINSFTSVSLEPPLILFCIGLNSLVYPALIGCRRFAINVLAAYQADLSTHFATPGKQDQWQTVATTERDGLPLLSGALAQLDCATEAIHPGGDHAIVVGRVVWLSCQPEAQPLLYFQGRYNQINAPAPP